MNVTVLEDFEKVNGTSLKGYISTTYAKLVEVFGEPTCEGDGYKIDAEWTLEFEDGTIATIYNWKNGRNYCGAGGMPVEMITEWNIGGHDGDAHRYVLEKVLAAS